ncbi:MAG: protein kinase domain-containing protein [Archangium sp.]
MHDETQKSADDDRSRRALDLFDELVELDADARERALGELRDPRLRVEVEALLEADARHDGVLERDVATLLPDADEWPARIGPWRITGIAGRGGMGAVYLGERADGQFQQRAAIKLIRLGMDTPQLRARFLRERQILAALEHPHIATLLDGGVTDTGAPYFAMQRVEGQPINAWSDERKLTIRQRVELFLQVCAAVQHAHQNLIVHRDLKPANILIEHDGRAKLLDFGIAKLLDDGIDATKERPHTPDYAAPEQMTGGSITTATDVFSLGVVLHGLLCGRPPREATEPLSRAVTNTSEDMARARGVSSKQQLAREVRGDLSAIVQHCLEEDPARRYASVNALAEDLRAWLDGRPVTARNPTRSYLLKKFVARNRFGVAAATVLLLAIIGGVAGVLWQAGKARKSAAEAQAQLDYLGHLLQVLAPSTAEARELDRSRLIAEATQRARAELKEPASLAGVEFALAQVAVGVGDYKQALDLADSAYALRAKTFGADSLPAAEVAALAGAVRILVSPPRFDEAGKMLDEAIAVIRAQAPNSALLVEALQKRSTVFGDQNKLAEQKTLISEAIALCEQPAGREAACEEVWSEQGSIASQQRKPEDAIGPYKRAYESRKARLGAEHAKTLAVAGMLAWSQAEANDLAGGLKLAEEVHAAYQRIFTQPNDTSLRAQLRLFRIAKRAGQMERAVTLIDDYLVQAVRVFGEHNPNTTLGYSDRASLLYGLGRFEESAAGFGHVADEYAAQKNEISSALTRTFQGEALREAGKPAEGLPLQSENVAKLRTLYPKGEHILLGRTLTSLALTEQALGRLDRAIELHTEAAAMLRKLQTAKSTHGANAEGFLAKARFDAGKTQEGEAMLRAVEKELAPYKADAINQYWEPFALLTEVACANGAADCETLKQQAREALSLSALSAVSKRRLHTALGE